MAITRVSNAAAVASVDSVVDLLDAGAGAGTIKIYTGTPPADVATAASGTLLGTLTLSDPAFGGAVDVPGSTLARATASAITSDTSADAAGTAGWFRAADSDGLAIIDGDITTVAVGTGAMTMTSTTVDLSDTISISAWTFDQSEV